MIVNKKKEMKKKKKTANKPDNMKRKILCFMVAFIAAFSQGVLFLTPVCAETAGETLIVRVGYFGDVNDYRLKAELSRQQLEALPQYTTNYTNVTRVGTIMYTVAQGPKVEDVLALAGIDVWSAQTMHLRTTDATGETNNWFSEFTAAAYLSGNRFYYPNINGKWETLSESSGQALSGGTAGAQPVHTILAIRSYSTKNPEQAAVMTPAMMDEEKSYRFCTGQTPLREYVPTTMNDVSSKDSAKWIFGIDVTLYGSSEREDPNDPNDIVGSEKDSGSMKDNGSSGLFAREVTLGAAVEDEEKTMKDRKEMSENAEELAAEARDPKALAIAGSVAGGALMTGLFVKLILFLKEV